jgi:hypothetical protein
MQGVKMGLVSQNSQAWSILGFMQLLLSIRTVTAFAAYPVLEVTRVADLPGMVNA